MRIISQKELSEILEKHKKWLNNEEDGERADLSYTDLSYTDLNGVKLSEADLSHADLSYADLSYADLSYADLSHTDLRFADLQGANLYNITLKSVKRTWLVTVNNIGSRYAETLYFADDDNVRCGCWNNYMGGTLSEFKARVDETYPADSENKEYQRYRFEYLLAIRMFESMREAYLESVTGEKSNE